jgi:LacI family transcriptional regulator
MKTSVHSTSELAERLGLSRWTVSRALNGQPGVNAETAERVREAAREAGFAPSILGRGLRSGKTDLIGVVAPDLEDFQLTRKISVLRDRIEEAGWHGIFQITDSSAESERDALERLSAIRCAGVINFGSRLEYNETALSRFVSAGIPVVMIDPEQPGSDRVVLTDRAAALREALKHLHSLGHREFAVLGINAQTTYGKQRVEGLLKTGRQLKLDVKKALRFFSRDEKLDDFEAGAAMIRAVLSAPGKTPSAVIAHNDRTALGALSVLQEHGPLVPDEISLVGYDNTDFCPYTTPALTTLDPKSSDLVHAAMDLLLSPEPGRRVIVPQMVIRQSTAAH